MYKDYDYDTGNFADKYNNNRPESSLDPDPEDPGLPGKDETDLSFGRHLLIISSVSEYNEGQAIKYVVTFHPTLPPLKASEKRRRNARTEAIKSSTYVHEKLLLAEVIEACILAIGRDPQLLQFKVVGTQLCTTAFTIKYSIPGHSALKDVQLITTGHYDELSKEAVKKGSPEVRLEITEDANDGQSEDELTLGPQQKKRKLTGEEEEIVETIVQLKAMYMCTDKRCSSPTCFLGSPTGQHVRLIPMHLSTWASAILAKHEDIDLQTPPTDKMFYPLEGHDNADDISLLTRRCNQSNKVPVATNNITVNPDYNGLVNLLQLIQNLCPATPVHYCAPAHPPSHSASPLKPAALTFEAFCEATGIPHLIPKLVILEIDGLHLLEFIGNTDLNKYLSVGQRASLCYAQLQWKKGLVR
ncbi:hypothetical protein B0H14DRAFT_3589786 [Mycena olivaceomarginata]|nr:hypothetical protein B0H14DRAFT_3589786 [Mycena olivaceomarginata]